MSTTVKLKKMQRKASSEKAKPLSAKKKAADTEAARTIKRRGNLAALKDYLAFAVNTLIGLSLSVAGGIGLGPYLFSTAIQHPFAAAGAGATLLAGPQMVRALLKILPELSK